jgi:hypothetical protein
VTPAALAELLDILSRAGVLTVAVLIIIGFMTGRIVPKGHLEEVRKERDAAQHGHEETLKLIWEELRRLADKVHE